MIALSRFPRNLERKHAIWKIHKLLRTETEQCVLEKRTETESLQIAGHFRGVWIQAFNISTMNSTNTRRWWIDNKIRVWSHPFHFLFISSLPPGHTKETSTQQTSQDLCHKIHQALIPWNRLAQNQPRKLIIGRLVFCYVALALFRWPKTVAFLSRICDIVNKNPKVLLWCHNKFARPRWNS